jgi:hypothetical protein
MKKIIHYHKYERMTWPNGRVFYKCMLPGCPHYMPIAELAIGSESLCWNGCNRLVIMTKDDFSRELKHLLCEVCKAEKIAKREEMAKL